MPCSQLGRTFESVSRPAEAMESYRVAMAICNGDNITTLAGCLALGNLHLVCLNAVAAASCFEQALACLALLKVRDNCWLSAQCSARTCMSEICCTYPFACRVIVTTFRTVKP